MSEAAIYQTREDGGSEGTRTVRLRVAASAENASLARLALSGVAGLAPVPERTLAELKLALTDAVGLAARHASARGAAHVEVVFELRADELRIEVADDGVVFEPAPAGGDGELATGSIGRLGDAREVDVDSGSGELRLRLVKRLRAAV